MGIRMIDLEVDDFIGKLREKTRLGSIDEEMIRRLMKLFQFYLESNLRGEKSLFGRFGMPDNLSDVTREPQFQDLIKKSFGESLFEKSMKLMEDQAKLYDRTMHEYHDIDQGNLIPIDQEEYIQASPEKRMLIEAGPGAGKTWALVQKLLYMIDSKNKNHIDANQVLVLTFSRAAAAVIRSRLHKEAENYPHSSCDNIQIATIDSFAWNLLQAMKESNAFNFYVREFSRCHEKKIHHDYDWYINEAFVALRDSFMHGSNAMEFLGFKFIAVDEVQDINGIRADFILKLLKQLPLTAGISVLGDPCQAIYDFSQKDGETTAVEFFNQLQDIEGMKHYCFTGNYRSHLSMNSILNMNRSYFTDADSAEKTRGVVYSFKEIIKKVSWDDLPGSIRWISKLSEAAGEESTIAVLVRKNDEALVLFDYFHDNQIPFFWQRRRNGDPYLAGWIGYFFHEYKDEYIGKDSFISAFKTIFQSEKAEKLLRAGGNNPEKYWEALEGCLDINKNERREKYTVEKLLRDLYHNAHYVKEDYRILFSGIIPDQKVILSNVHQAKGREYDYVFLLEDLLTPTPTDKEKLNEECRIAYVGMTRPVNGIVQIENPSDDIFDRTFFKDELSRFNQLTPIYWNRYRYGYGSVKKVSKFEVGYDVDFTPESFARERYVQNWIHDLVPIGQTLKLNQKYEELYELIWDVDVQGYEIEIPLAESSETFHKDLAKLVNHYDCNKVWPEGFSHIYANDLITFISPKEVGEGAKKFGNCYIWNGIDAVGMGTAEYSS